MYVRAIASSSHCPFSTISGIGTSLRCKIVAIVTNAPQYARIEIAEQREEYMNKMIEMEPTEEEENDVNNTSMENMEKEWEANAGAKRKGRTGKSRGARANNSRRASARDRGEEGRARGA